MHNGIGIFKTTGGPGEDYGRRLEAFKPHNISRAPLLWQISTHQLKNFRFRPSDACNLKTPSNSSVELSLGSLLQYNAKVVCGLDAEKVKLNLPPLGRAPL